MLKWKELKSMPLPLLQAMAEALSRDIDAGQDKRDCLERVFQAIKTEPKNGMVPT